MDIEGGRLHRKTAVATSLVTEKLQDGFGDSTDSKMPLNASSNSQQKLTEEAPVLANTSEPSLLLHESNITCAICITDYGEFSSIEYFEMYYAFHLPPNHDNQSHIKSELFDKKLICLLIMKYAVEVFWISKVAGYTERQPWLHHWLLKNYRMVSEIRRIQRCH